MNKFFMVVSVGPGMSPATHTGLYGTGKATFEEAKQFAAAAARAAPHNRRIILESLGEVSPPVLPVDFKSHK